jgi:acetyl esterase/lipase
MTKLPDIPARLRSLMAEIGPIWASDTRGHIKLMIDSFSDVLKLAPRDGIRVESNVSYGTHDRQRFEVFHPATASRTGAALIFVHGGAFTEGSRNRTDEIYSNVLYYFARHGFVGINAGYRLAPDATYPEASRDIATIVAWTRANAEELGIDPRRIFLMGHSAGAAHTASFVYDKRLHPEDGPGVAGHIVISGRVRADNRADNPNARRVEAYYGSDATLFDDMSPITHVDAGSPPTFIAAAEFENPLIDIYCLELAHRIAVVKGRAPPFLWLRGHNHTSIIGHINTSEDLLGAAIRQFMAATLQEAEAQTALLQAS